MFDLFKKCVKFTWWAMVLIPIGMMFESIVEYKDNLIDVWDEIFNNPQDF